MKSFMLCYIKWLIVVLLGVGVVTLVEAEDYGEVTIDEVVRVYDGDTFYANIVAWPPIIGENIPIRVNGIDTPEIRTKNKAEKLLGKQAKALADSILTNSKQITLKNIQRPKYFRILADVDCDGQDLATIMLDRGFAIEYNGGTKKKVW